MPRTLLTILLLLAAVATARAQAPGAGSEDDPWLLDVDALLAEGFAVIVTPEDTVAVADAAVDTIRVAAPRLRVSEVVRRIAAAMAAAAPHGGMRFTELIRVETWSDRDDPERARRSEHTAVTRISVDQDGERRAARLRGRTRSWKAGELERDEETVEVEREWQDDVVELTMAMPFDLLTMNDYRYDIRERTLIGGNLVFRVGFAPRDPFETGLAGEVWIDYSDFVIRRLEGAVTGPMPVPVVMRAVPRFAMTLVRIDGFWVADAFHAEVELNGGLPGVPDGLAIHAAMEGYVFGEESE